MKRVEWMSQFSSRFRLYFWYSISFIGFHLIWCERCWKEVEYPFLKTLNWNCVIGFMFLKDKYLAYISWQCIYVMFHGVIMYRHEEKYVSQKYWFEIRKGYEKNRQVSIYNYLYWTKNVFDTFNFLYRIVPFSYKRNLITSCCLILCTIKNYVQRFYVSLW